MPVRKIPKSYRTVTGISAARKAKGEARFESRLEHDFLTLLDFDPVVRVFEVQPVTIRWRDSRNKHRTYIPDCLVEYAEGIKPPTLFEVKFRSDLWKHWDEHRAKFRAAVHYASCHAMRFTIITEKEIRTDYLNNVRFLLPFVRRGIQTPELEPIVMSALSSQGRTTPTLLVSSLSKDREQQAIYLPALWYLIGTFRVAVDLWAPMNMDSAIWLTPQKDPWHSN
jgi:hypothetical protein